MNRTRRNIIPIPDIKYIILNIEGLPISNPLKSRNIKTLTELQTMPGYSERLVEEIESTKLDNKYQLYTIEDDIVNLHQYKHIFIYKIMALRVNEIK